MDPPINQHHAAKQPPKSLPPILVEPPTYGYPKTDHPFLRQHPTPLSNYPPYFRTSSPPASSNFGYYANYYDNPPYFAPPNPNHHPPPPATHFTNKYQRPFPDHQPFNANLPPTTMLHNSNQHVEPDPPKGYYSDAVRSISPPANNTFFYRAPPYPNYGPPAPYDRNPPPGFYPNSYHQSHMGGYGPSYGYLDDPMYQGATTSFLHNNIGQPDRLLRPTPASTSVGLQDTTRFGARPEQLVPYTHYPNFGPQPPRYTYPMLPYQPTITTPPDRGAFRPPGHQGIISCESPGQFAQPTPAGSVLVDPADPQKRFSSPQGSKTSKKSRRPESHMSRVMDSDSGSNRADDKDGEYLPNGSDVDGNANGSSPRHGPIEPGGARGTKRRRSLATSLNLAPVPVNPQALDCPTTVFHRDGPGAPAHTIKEPSTPQSPVDDQPPSATHYTLDIRSQLSHPQHVDYPIMPNSPYPPIAPIDLPRMPVPIAPNPAFSPAEPCLSIPANSTLHSISSRKRKYRRHPKTDLNEPQKPQSAYVVFANEVRTEMREKKLTFSELAKIVGDRWKCMPLDEKRAREKHAARSKQEYHYQLGLYRRSPSYHAYQAYLRDFEAATANVIDSDTGKKSGNKNMGQRLDSKLVIPDNYRGLHPHDLGMNGAALGADDEGFRMAMPVPEPASNLQYHQTCGTPLPHNSAASGNGMSPSKINTPPLSCTVLADA